MGAMIDIDTLCHDARFGGYCAEPDGPAGAAVIVVQEIFGVNPGIRAKCDEWAAAGYLAIAPDLFWRSQPGVELEPETPGDFEKAVALMQACDVDRAIGDIEASIRAARARLGDAHGKVGVVGFCFGGLLAYLSATRTDADAAVGYYGGRIDAFLGESHAIGKPLLLHFALEDAHIDAAARQAVHAALDDNRHVGIEEYAGADHGFAATSGSRRNDAAAKKADARTSAFFAEHLG
ncbi:dienelactone hydrolase family protein [Sphingomonas solaris]|uniref:Dienelactone hydrolase family protein n=1 Tax=Alterirhizorhabdus solaris TaxID=2529389 RepID=A0A558R3I7_9SPHN|nr:dienelactone hydrolase family protein [Sphingomonas solaris]TVV73898.1 dienelactone hydrolase family protein [Sphingomonas solaris]